jgi:hypothetical protein
LDSRPLNYDDGKCYALLFYDCSLQLHGVNP